VGQHLAGGASRPAACQITMRDLLKELTSGDDARAENAVPALVDLGEEVIPALLDLTRSDDVDSRWWAVRALAASPHAQITDLIPLLADSSSEVRAAAALALCNHPHESAVEALIHTLADVDSLTAGLAANALVLIGGASVPSLLEIMDKAPTSVRTRSVALRALSEIRDHRAIPIMMKCLGEESAILRYWAQEGLTRLGLDMVYVKP
jgi:HEAT repeat protein